MKKISILCIFCFTLWGNAQNPVSQESSVLVKQENTVSVIGKVPLTRKITRYRAKITLNLEQHFYANSNCKSLEEMKAAYFEKLKENDIDPTKLEERKMEFLAYGYQKEGTVLVFESDSEEDIQKIAKIQMAGKSVQYLRKAALTGEQRQTVLMELLKNAEENALRICRVANKKLGALISISETGLQDFVWRGYHSDYMEYATINVTYKME